MGDYISVLTDNLDEFVAGFWVTVRIVVFAFAGLRRAGADVGPWEAGIASLGLYTAAYVAEALRSGVFSVSKGQIEAALSLGFPYGETMRRIILPQAFRTVISPL